MPVNVLESVRSVAHQSPGSIAACEVESQRAITYGQLNAAVSTLANRIDATVPRGGVILLSYPNQIECLVGFLAVLSAGRVVFPIPPSTSARELRSSCDRGRVRAVLGRSAAVEALYDDGHQSVSLAIEMPDWATHTTPTLPFQSDGNSNGAGLMLMSSGTTGVPKIAYRSGKSLESVARNLSASAGFSRGDHVLGVVPMCHSYGVENVMLSPMLSGCCVHLLSSLDPRLIAKTLTVNRVTILPGTPTVYEAVLDLDASTLDGHSLRFAYSAGAPLPRSIYDAFLDRFGIRIGQLYGATEVGSVMFNHPDDESFDPQSVGNPMEGVVVRVIASEALSPAETLETNEGEVLIRSPSMMDHYLGQSESPFEDGFFRTGDLGVLDDRGRLRITGRLKLLIDVGGLKVNPLEVEQVLSQHEMVSECVVVAVPVTKTVSRVKAIVTPGVPRDLWSQSEVQQFARQHLSSYKIPRVFELRDSLPRSATGKILRRELF
jgi:long-chain acyl-CoA synthetase